MADTYPIILDGVSKKFRKGESHDSLRDLIPSLLRRAVGGERKQDTREFWALRDIQLRIPAGQVCGIIGANGAGKSTLLKLLSRILTPDSGRLVIDGRVSALIEVGAGFHPDLTGRENIHLYGCILGMTRKQVEQRYEQIVNFAELHDFIDTPIKRYSSGMYARLGFSVAAHVDPSILLVDEVLSVGDMRFQNKCLAKICEIRDRGATIIFVSHNLQSVHATCSRVVVLSAGRVTCDAAPAEAISEYVRHSSPGSGDCPHADRRGEIVSAELLRRGKLLDGQVTPGEHLTCRVRYKFYVDCANLTFGFLVRRWNDGLYVYDATASELGVTPLAVRRGQEITLDFNFVVNLTRGVYNVALHVRDLKSQTFLDYNPKCAIIDVREAVTYAGVADLEVACVRRQALAPGHDPPTDIRENQPAAAGKSAG